MQDPVEVASEIVQEAIEKCVLAKKMVAGIKAKLSPEEIAAALAAPVGKTLGLINALLAKDPMV